MTKDSLARVIDRIETLLMVLLLLAMTGVTFVQVVMRYVFNSGFPWALELTIYLFSALVLLGAGNLMKHNAHLGVSAFVQLFSAPVRKGMGLTAALACIVYAVLLAYGSWFYVQRMFQIGIATHDLHLPKWVPLSVLPIGLGIFALRSLQGGWMILTGRRKAMTSDGEGDIAASDGNGVA